MPTINYETGERTPPVEEQRTCAHCGEPRHFGSTLCEECEQLQECDRCGQLGELSHSDSYGGALCENCDERYYCSDCGSDYTYEEDAESCCRERYYCPRCDSSFYDEDDAAECCGSGSYHGTVPQLDFVQPYPISVPEIDGRVARLCSVEQELADGGLVTAAMLRHEGLSQFDYIRDYHSSGGGESGWIHVEQDGSLPSGGGEVVYDRFDLSKPWDSERLSAAVTKIRQLRDQHKLVKTSFAAGTHIHISAKAEDGTCLSPRDVAALYELWCYAEDMLYSLSAAGWNRHRQPDDQYSGYCKAVPKVEGSATPTKVWRVMRSDRFFGLNFQRLYNAVSSCSCGAATMGDWESCDCGAMDRGTIEWRVFNGSTLPRTLHAWIVMAQAMTAYSQRHELGTLPSQPYGSTDSVDKRVTLNYLLEVLPLTDGERELILDAADRSPGL